MGNRRHKKASKSSALERSTVETVEKGTVDSNDKKLTKKASNSNDEDTTGDNAEVSEKTNSKSDVSAATKDVTEDDDNYLPNEPDKCVNNSISTKNVNGSSIFDDMEDDSKEKESEAAAKEVTDDDSDNDNVLQNGPEESISKEKETLDVEVTNNVNGSSTLDEMEDELKDNELELDKVNEKNIENNTNCDTEVVKQAPVLRLVAIEKLLKPIFMKEKESVKASTSVKSKQLAKKLLKTSSRSRKNISYVEISDSSENETIESINSSSENEERSKKQSGSSRKSGGDLSSKENNSTNNILSDGKSKNDFTNPTIISPSKSKMVKSLSVNIEKMPTNVNKLMKVYTVNEERNHDELKNSEPLDIWSESDDFENMISTSKIEKKSSDAEKSPKTNANNEKEKSTRSTRLNKASSNVEMFSTDSSTSKKTNSKQGPTKAPHKAKNDHIEVTTRTTRNSENKASSSTSSRTEAKAIKEESTPVIEENTSKRPIRNRQNNVKLDEKMSSKSNLKVCEVLDDTDKESSVEMLGDSSASEKESIAPETRNKKRSPRKKLSHEIEDSDHSSCSNENKVQKTKEDSTNVSSSNSDEEIPQDDRAPILETRMRSREKYEKNTDFISLKQTIALRKKRKLEEVEPKTKSKSSIQSTDNASKFKIPLKTKKTDQEITPKTENTEISQTNAKNQNTVVDSHPNADVKMEQNDKNNDSIKMATTKRTAANRKRLLSSSEEEDEEEVPKMTKKKKMSSDEEEEEEDYKEDAEENGQSEEESDDSDSNSKQKKKKSNRSDDESNVEEEDDDDDDEKDVKSKRRKRIKEVASSNDEDDDKDSPTKGRKNIRKLMKGDKLDISTKEAAKLERERKQRIDERQKLYNQFYDERPEEVKEITKLVLDFNETTKKPLLQVHKKLVSKLKPHQANGIKFMWDACFESLERCNEESGSGAILAHCMGLGKTLQVITLIHTLLANSDKTNTTRILVVCPLSTILNWVNEFNIWFKDIEGSEDIYIYEINKLKQNADRANKLMEWHNDGGVMILSYDMFRNLTNDQGSRIRKKVRDSLQTSLLNPGPDLVICDEGHLLKNEKTSISKAMNRLTTLRRIVLTGTPLQNNLKEYYCMVQFVKPNLLGKYQEYMNRFVNPITNGQYTDSTAFDIQVMKRRSHVLHKLLNGCVQRRDYNVLAPFLPPKHEYVISIKMSPMQIKLYKFYMENRSRSNEEQKKGSILFQDFQNLQRIWTAPLVLRYNSDKYEQVQQKKRDNMDTDEESDGSLKDFIDDDGSNESSSDDSLESDNSDDEVMSINSDEPLKKSKKMKKKNTPAPRRTRASRAEEKVSEPEEEPAIIERKDNPTEWWKQICPESELNNLEHASKLSLLMSILEECEAIGDKLLVFSQSLYSLDVIEHFLGVIDDQPQAKHTSTSYTGSWTLGRDYYRLDGSTPVEARNTACKSFNRKDNPRSRLFLISTRAGGLGINLVAANRVVIFDVSWNPSHDIQSIFRVYRFGQTKPCYVYRFLALGTMEEKIYERQVTKQAISKRVIDEQQIDRHYKENDLQELYNYDLEPDDERILPLLPKDRLFAEMLKKYEDMIYKYHEHETLLENKEEETLNEEERKAAWDDFEAEKNRPQFVPYVQQQSRGIGPVTSNNIFGIRTDILLKLLSMKARLDNPTINDYEVKQVIPMLMQELYRQMDRGDLTLYQQLLALSSSLETPVNYGGQFVVNEGFHNQQRSMPSTSSSVATASMGMYRQHLERNQQQLQFQRNQQEIVTENQNRYLNQKRPPPTINPTVIEID